MKMLMMVYYAVETPVASSRSAGLTMSPSIFAKFGSRFNTVLYEGCRGSREDV